MSKLQEVAKLQKEAVELLKEEKIADAVAKLESSTELLIEKEEVVEVEKTEKVEIAKTIEAEVKKYADVYFSWEDLQSLIKQIIEASDLTKNLETIAKELEEIKKTETESKQLNPSEIEKTDDKNSVWEGL